MAGAFATLRRTYGTIALREPREPFALIVWENAGYLIDDVTRSRVFAKLRKTIGMKPAALLAAPPGALQDAIKEGGMQPAHRAAKIRRCAELAVHYADGDLKRTLQAFPPVKRRALLKMFPGIGDPGADKVLLLCRLSDSPALDSNGLRVLERLGFIATDTSYARMYKSGTAVVTAWRRSAAKSTEAFSLLREHGRELCKRSAPICPACPLRVDCVYAQAHAVAL
jgi:endonuclease-3